MEAQSVEVEVQSVSSSRSQSVERNQAAPAPAGVDAGMALEAMHPPSVSAACPPTKDEDMAADSVQDHAACDVATEEPQPGLGDPTTARERSLSPEPTGDASGADCLPEPELQASGSMPPESPFARGDVEDMWEPPEVSEYLRVGEGLEFESEVVDNAYSLAQEVEELRALTDGELAGWASPMDEKDTHAMYVVALNLHMGIPWDARSDLLCARLFGLLQGGDMRAHEEAVYLYEAGHMSALTEIPGYKVRAMEIGLARATTIFYHLMHVNAPRQWAEVFALLRRCEYSHQKAIPRSRFVGRLAISARPAGKGKGGDVAPPPLTEDGRWWGEAGTALFQLSVRFSRKADTCDVLMVYHAWFRQDRPADKGIIDCKDISFQLVAGESGLNVRQVPKSRDNDCYVYIPVTLGYKPSEAHVQRLRRVLCTAYAGSAYERRAVTAMECLSIVGAEMPQMCIVMRGRGRNTKTTLSKLRANVLGTGHKAVPASVLHVPEEMRKQLLHFSQARCITIKECQGRVWLEEDVTKNLFGRDELAGRLLFGKATKTFALERCGMFWEVNVVPPCGSTATRAT